MRLASFHKGLRDAEAFVKDLKLQGTKGVKIGKKGRKGYPVSSVLLDEVGFGDFSNLNFKKVKLGRVFGGRIDG